MALGDPYASVAELQVRVGLEDPASVARMGDALRTASRGLERYCGRQFNAATVASARTFYADDSWTVTTDDFWTTSGLLVASDPNDTGTFSTSWLAANYQLEPLNGVVDGEPGWPYWRIRGINQYWPVYGQRPSVQVTAQWGWLAVPDPIKEACLALAEAVFNKGPGTVVQEMIGSDAGTYSVNYGSLGAVTGPLDKAAPYRRIRSFA